MILSGDNDMAKVTNLLGLHPHKNCVSSSDFFCLECLLPWTLLSFLIILLLSLVTYHIENYPLQLCNMFYSFPLILLIVTRLFCSDLISSPTNFVLILIFEDLIPAVPKFSFTLFLRQHSSVFLPLFFIFSLPTFFPPYHAN